MTNRWERSAKIESRIGLNYYKRRLRLASEERKSSALPVKSQAKWDVYPSPLPARMFASGSTREEALCVPTPAEKVIPEAVTYLGREGQGHFRSEILDAYKRCAVSGTRIPEVLEAAHIIPYVDERSNKIENGLCLRADIHRLFDKGLIAIGADYIVHLHELLAHTAYASVEGKRLKLPVDEKLWPNQQLLHARQRFVPQPS